ncbi:MAG TPA: hypothetical protein VKV02_12865, partial [Acidobacteriaceae bacterium]|nr:hypothetical protein [Acidobacteriaceae bacterium]
MLPGFFEFGTRIEGIDATDLFSLNSVLGTSIEVQVVSTLNKMRGIWDPDEHWVGYRFERQSQVFPDVLLIQRGLEKPNIAMGIELKGWYLLSKEGVPTFRFPTTAEACSIYDLIAVVPWHLSSVTSGSPVAREPWVESARYAAEYRNYWWQHMRDTSDPRGIRTPVGAQPYPTKDMHVTDLPDYDPGRNFGRLARIAGLMADWVEAAKAQEALGIPINDWVAFLKRHGDTSDPEAVVVWLQRELRKATRAGSEEKAARVLEH